MTSAIRLSGDTRKRKTREALCAAMLDLLAEKPFDEIQILELTVRAGVGYATFFRHYAQPVEVLDEVAGELIRELLAMTVPAFERTDSAAGLRSLCGYVLERRALWHTLLTGGAGYRVRAEFVRQAREWSRHGDGKPTSVPIDLGTVCAAGSAIDALAWWLDQGEAYSAEEMADFIDRLIISPFVGQMAADQSAKRST